MRHVADAERAVVDLAGLCLRARDQILDRFDSGGGIDHGAERISGGLGDRDEIAKRVVGQLLVDERVGRHRAHRRVDQRIAVGRGLGAGLHADDGVGAGTIVDHSLLAPQLVHLLREHARLQVDPGAGRLRHDDADGTVGIIVCRLRRAGIGEREQRRARQRGNK